jgi:hypothetical protein
MFVGRHHRFLRTWLGILLGCCACTEDASTPDVDVTSGALGLQCKPGEIEVGEVAYTITRSGAAVRTGKFSIDDGHKGFSAVIGPLPVGDDYTINLQAQALRVPSGDTSDCSGDTGFSVAARQTTVVAITLRCGGVKMRGQDENQCPRIDSVRAVPCELPVGSIVTLRGDAHDVDRKLVPLQFDWTAREGMLTDAMESRASYMCTSPGRQAITLKVSDGDDTCPEESVTVFITCRPAPGSSAIAKACTPATLAAGRSGAGVSGAICAGASGAKTP